MSLQLGRKPPPIDISAAEAVGSIVLVGLSHLFCEAQNRCFPRRRSLVFAPAASQTGPTQWRCQALSILQAALELDLERGARTTSISPIQTRRIRTTCQVCSSSCNVPSLRLTAYRALLALPCSLRLSAGSDAIIMDEDVEGAIEGAGREFGVLGAYEDEDDEIDGDDDDDDEDDEDFLDENEFELELQGDYEDETELDDPELAEAERLATGRPADAPSAGGAGQQSQRYTLAIDREPPQTYAALFPYLINVYSTQQLLRAYTS